MAILGSIYYNQAGNAWQPSATTLVKARAALATAVRIDPDLIPAHFTLSGMYMGVDWDWAGAQREIDEMRAIDPTNSRYLPRAIAIQDGGAAPYFLGIRQTG